MNDLRHLTTERLRLDVPTHDDLPELHEIYGDPQMWTHDPAHRQTEDATRAMLAGWIESWESEGLAPWIVRSLTDDAVLGNAGCWLRSGEWWNLGYGIAAACHGRGLATEAVRPALAAAVATRPDTPVIARVLERNTASVRVAEKLGLSVQYRGPDTRDPDAVRLVYSDRFVPSQRAARWA